MSGERISSTKQNKVNNQKPTHTQSNNLACQTSLTSQTNKEIQNETTTLHTTHTNTADKKQWASAPSTWQSKERKDSNGKSNQP